MKLHLQRGRLLRVTDGAGKTVTAHGGEVWITEEDSRRDVLRPAVNSLPAAEFHAANASGVASVNIAAILRKSKLLRVKVPQVLLEGS